MKLDKVLIVRVSSDTFRILRQKEVDSNIIRKLISNHLTDLLNEDRKKVLKDSKHVVQRVANRKKSKKV